MELDRQAGELLGKDRGYRLREAVRVAEKQLGLLDGGVFL